ncbi:MAG: alpha/beta hydrolase [Hyphomicrobiaceae bacterium]|nr:alpha/beta hydrolase [Hyphomicrobiaceae bacterium]
MIDQNGIAGELQIDRPRTKQIALGAPCMTVIQDYFQSDGIEIAYRVDRPKDREPGEAKIPVLLIHGFVSNGETNWVGPSWTTTLLKAGYETICIDNRGHGKSQKLYDPERYSAPLMAQDAFRLLDHLGVEQAYVMGYSMGARITAFMLQQNEQRIKAAVFAGMGINMVRGLGGSAPIAEAFEAERAADVEDLTARSFRAFAKMTGGDLKALAACLRGPRLKVTKEMLAKITTPTLIAVGTVDDVAGSPEELSVLIPHSKILPIPDRDHMKSVGDPVYKKGVLAFLRENAASV